MLCLRWKKANELDNCTTIIFCFLIPFFAKKSRKIFVAKVVKFKYRFHAEENLQCIWNETKK